MNAPQMTIEHTMPSLQDVFHGGGFPGAALTLAPGFLMLGHLGHRSLRDEASCSPYVDYDSSYGLMIVTDSAPDSAASRKT